MLELLFHRDASLISFLLFSSRRLSSPARLRLTKSVPQWRLPAPAPPPVPPAGQDVSGMSHFLPSSG